MRSGHCASGDGEGCDRSAVNAGKDYLRKLIVNYQQAACENLIDAEMNELLQLAAARRNARRATRCPAARIWMRRERT